jgi:A/G-specific adenine glycosylase
MPGSIAALLLPWYDKHQRDLPWRMTRDPYAIWVSETMLQQTQVATAIGYWERWMAQFPTPTALADAPLDDVLKAWQGLGYYARARNLHRAAQVIRDTHGGQFPTTFDDVLALPGVGRYTAGAVCSIALGLDTPIVDANVIRVLCRVDAIPGDPKTSRVQERLWQRAEQLIPLGQAREFNQAMMELGALVCGKEPKCNVCPLQPVCQAFAQDAVARFPEFAAKKTFTTQTDVSAVVRNDAGQYLLIQRPPDGLWGGLWELPRVTQTESESLTEAALRAVREVTGGTATSTGTVLARVKHGVTTRKITLLAVECTLTGTVSIGTWVAPNDFSRYALSSPQVKLVAQLRERTVQPTLF